jgi:hypothetical protein
MLSAMVFYTLLFLALVVVPAGVILVVLLFLDHEHRLWQSVTAVVEPKTQGLRQGFPRATGFLARRLDTHDPWGLRATLAGVGILIGLWLFLGVLQDIVAKDPLVTLNSRLHNTMPLFRTTGMTWFGGRMEPISLVVVGSEADVVRAFTRAGWTRADLPTPVRLVREGLAALRNRPDSTGPATPAFFADRPQNLTFEKPDPGAPSIRRRHHVRLWRTDYCLAPKCRPVWVGTASFDVGVELSQRLHLPTHRIDPAIDKARALIAGDLVRGGATQEGSVVVSQPVQGTNAAGDPFSTDGGALVLILPE